MIQLVDARLPEATAERVRQSHRDAIKELQSEPLIGTRVIRDVELANATETPIAHRLGRRAVVLVSPPRGASSTGRIEEVRSSTYDPTKYVVLEANGHGATITVDLVLI